jgi:RNA polymerase sigma-70 factor (ECF subfamily)
MPEPAPDLDLARCLDRVRANDQAAARELVEYLYPQVIRIVRAHLPRRMQEEDLAQEVFMKMFARLGQFQGTVPFPHWVSRIAVTTCIDQLRAQKRRPELRWADLSQTQADVLDAVMQSDEGQAPTDLLATHDLVYKLLEELNPEDRLVIQLLDLDQKSVAEIAVITGWNSALIKVRAFRARRKLRKIFENLQRKEHP